ncbi:hypothetical protein CQW23_29467 [Capsicum baccatum]|uniref:Flowering-promoting factor 1-like protein 3 n=1 Tax=Capsicum baccatum TaxID=33114 RepID=A0A2G2VJI3_CAPBA|nr:hypothetical protein CQW23_29467 [Capsicum baccatum]
MSGVWTFKNGVVRLENRGDYHVSATTGRRKVLVHVPSDEVISCYENLERKLCNLGWERFKSMHMYDIVVKNRNEFEVRDMWATRSTALRCEVQVMMDQPEVCADALDK